MPRRIDSAIPPSGSASPSSVTWPVAGRRPKIASSISLRPAPTSPPRPRISPACSVKDTPARLPSTCRSRTASTGTASGSTAGRSGNSSVISRPTMSAMICRSLSAAVASCRMMAPSRMIATVSEIASISSMRWLV